MKNYKGMKSWCEIVKMCFRTLHRARATDTREVRNGEILMDHEGLLAGGEWQRSSGIDVATFARVKCAKLSSLETIAGGILQRSTMTNEILYIFML